MKESEFLRSIDCSFPFEDENKALQIIHQAKEYSSNTAYAVLEEICRAPRSKTDQQANQLRYLGVWEQVHENPLNELIVPCAKAIITETWIPIDLCKERIERMRAFPGEYCALNIIYFSYEGDSWEEVDASAEEVKREWSKEPGS